MSKGFSRRDFLKGAAAGAVGVAAIGVAGCTNQQEPANVPADNTPSSPEEIVKPDLASAKYNTDIVIVGSGAAGMAAAVEAGQKGMKAVLLETNAYLGGTTNFAEGIFGYNTKYQKAMGINYDINDMVKGEMEFSNYKADYRIIKECILQSNENIEWLESLGVKFYDEVIGGVWKTQHLYYPAQGKSMISVLEPLAKELGVTILTSTRGRALYQENGKITGIMAEDAGGPFAIRTKAVVLACGGFLQSNEMIEAHTSYNMDRVITVSAPGHLGDSLTMAYEAGGDQSSPPLFMFIWAGVDGVENASHLYVAACNEPVLWVDSYSQRFVDESVLINFVSSIDNAILNQKTAYSILNQAEITRLTKEPCVVGYGSYTFAGTPLDKLQEQLDEALAKSLSSVFKADTVEELAQKIGIDPARLRATIDRNNEMYEKGEDTDFGKPASFLRSLKTGPFYAFDLKATALCTMGGIRVNTKSEVLSKNFDPIPGLYCAGVDCGGLNGDTYSYYLAALAQGYAVYSGRNSVRNALQYMA